MTKNNVHKYIRILYKRLIYVFRYGEGMREFLIESLSYIIKACFVICYEIS